MPAAPTVESATTSPSGRTMVMREAISRPRRSPSRASRSRPADGAARRGRNVSAASRARERRCSSASDITRSRTRKNPAVPARARAIPAITRWLRKNFTASENRRDKRPSPFPELVADVLHRLDRPGQERDFLAQFRDVDVHGPVDHVGVLSPHFRKDRLAGQDPPRGGEERLEDAELLRREGYGLSLVADLVPRHVHPEVSADEGRRFRL